MSKHNRERRKARPDALIVTPHPEANYHAKCVELAKNNPGLFQPGRVVMVNVLHDDWCAIHENRPCDCDCDVKFAVDETKN